MAYIVKMPKLGMGMSQGTFLEWFVSPADSVREGDPIAEIESEKSVAEITASEDGVLRRVYVAAGDTVEPGTALGIIAEADEPIDDLESQTDRESIEADADADAAAEPAETPDAADTDLGSDAGPSGDGDRLYASPKARSYAEDTQVDLTTVDGSGPDGAVVLADVEAAEADSEPAVRATDDSSTRRRARATPKARRRARGLDLDLADVTGSGPKGAVTSADLDATVGGEPTAPTAEAPSTAVGEAAERTPVEERDLSGMRQTIADRLGQSYREAVHVTVHREIQFEEALTAVDVVDDYLDTDVSITDIVLVALSATLSDHSEFNATFEDGAHRIHERQNVGIAVDVEDGLLTPVLSAVDERSLPDLVRARRELTDRALSGEYASADVAGGTFTVTNLGMFGVDSFTPIINPPEVAILGVNRVRERPVRADDGGVTFRRFGAFDLAFDHRVVDGADAARFLDTLETYLTSPWPLLLDRA